jgi:hypothetical protein
MRDRYFPQDPALLSGYGLCSPNVIGNGVSGAAKGLVSISIGDHEKSQKASAALRVIDTRRRKYQRNQILIGRTRPHRVRSWCALNRLGIAKTVVDR